MIRFRNFFCGATRGGDGLQHGSQGGRLDVFGIRPMPVCRTTWCSAARKSAEVAPECSASINRGAGHHEAWWGAFFPAVAVEMRAVLCRRSSRCANPERFPACSCWASCCAPNIGPQMSIANPSITGGRYFFCAVLGCRFRVAYCCDVYGKGGNPRPGRKLKFLKTIWVVVHVAAVAWVRPQLPAARPR